MNEGRSSAAEWQGPGIGTTYVTGLRIDEVLARYGGQGNRTYLSDALGSVLALTDDTQVTQTTYSYSPYGETAQTGPQDANALQYTGRETDTTGLDYYRARYYDPQLKRFISSDPMGLEGGLNTYGYVGGNPIGAVDPYGLARASNNGHYYTKYPKKFIIPDPSKLPTTKPDVENIESIPDIIKGPTSSIDEGTACVKAFCDNGCDKPFTITYPSDGPRYWDPDLPYPPSPSELPDGCLCKKVMIRGNFKGTLPGL
ncbi:MAG: RHS repeat-associated core domain-containing protein [Gammaproteobacteria bacterium]|nr:RHS repeat-associated core domain-containing protein [Gammaproteobacteria bacterium]